MGKRWLWLHHAEVHVNYPSGACYSPDHIGKQCPAMSAPLEQHQLRLEPDLGQQPAKPLGRSEKESVGAWLQRVRVETQIPQGAATGEWHSDVIRLQNGRCPLVTQRAAQLLASGYEDFCREGAAFAATSDYQDLWASYRLASPAAARIETSGTDRISSVLRAHKPSDATVVAAELRMAYEGHSDRAPRAPAQAASIKTTGTATSSSPCQPIQRKSATVARPTMLEQRPPERVEVKVRGRPTALGRACLRMQTATQSTPTDRTVVPQRGE